MLEDIIKTQYALVQELQDRARTIPSLEKMQTLESAIAGLRDLVEMQSEIESKKQADEAYRESIKDFEERREELRRGFSKNR